MSLEPSRTSRFRFSASAPSKRASHPRSDSRFPACWSILRADVGDRVAKGAVLARLDDREQSAQVARAKAAVEQTEANLQRAKASVERAQANYANAKRINERRQKLLQTNTTSVETAETAKTAQDAALADVNLANSDVLVARGQHQRRQSAAAAAIGHAGFSHPHGAL